MRIDPRERRILRLLWEHGPISRWELHEKTGFSPNLVGVLARGLIDRKLLRQRPAEPSNGGRPRVPLEIDPSCRHVIGLSIAPAHVEVARVGLVGHLQSDPTVRQVRDPRKLIAAAAELLEGSMSPATLAVGMSATGFVDPRSRRILFSSAMPGLRAQSLEPLYQRIGHLPVTLENDSHALAVRWMLTQRADPRQDVLLVSLDDGQVGAAMLIEGRPNRGCAIGANEIGHTRLPVETDRCFCGQTGCLERICSTAFLRRHGSSLRLQQAAEAYPDDAPGLDHLLDLLAMGLSNAVNFMRPARMVLTGPLIFAESFVGDLIRRIRELLLVEIAARLRVELWHEPILRSAHTAAWLALARLYFDGWSEEDPVTVSDEKTPVQKTSAL